MKKALIASTALVLTAGIAAADVTISGYGRTGLLYQEDGIDGEGTNDTIVQSRLRMNVDASTSTDQGIDFGGRIRVQWDQGDAATTLAPGYIYMTTQGFRVEIGNSNTAFDSVGLIYDPEIGVYDRSFGDPRGLFFAYNTDGYPTHTLTAEQEERLRLQDYMGVFASYTMGDLVVRGSVINPDQVNKNSLFEKEIGISADYTWNNIELAAAAVWDGAGIKDNDQFFVGARYNYNDVAHVGLNYNDNGDFSHDVDDGTTVRNLSLNLGDTWTLYGDYTFGLTTINGYVAWNDASDVVLVDGIAENETDTSFGLGANYDLGGARLSGSIQRGYDELYTADLGVRFDF
ncbi:porin [Paracoccus marinaquae]|uniref:Porin n=1 Tax=Paracoccus marinaquae TaxID=2841926 RepID=A0ABS6AKU6_9RHOB|nr:porin [Paracoccus marinaquae]MBU3031198.1 porin [Paracoccus marinaquae]